jgi:hypothetical protein
MATKSTPSVAADRYAAAHLAEIVPTISEMDSLQMTALVRAILARRLTVNAAKSKAGKATRAKALRERKAKLEAELAKLR